MILDVFDRVFVDLAVLAVPDAVRDGQPVALHLMRILEQFLGNPMLKMGPLVLLLLYSWLRWDRGGQGRGILSSPEVVVRGTFAIGLALAAGRLAQEVLPMRQRPRFAHPDLVFAPTSYGVTLDDWSSMPSDHAMLVAAIVAVVWAGGRGAGALAALWGIAAVCLPRVYFGFHYASDIVAGFGLGLLVVAIVLRMPLPSAAWTWLRDLDERVPALVVLGLSGLAWSIGESFDSARILIAVVRKGSMVEQARPALFLVAAVGVLVAGLAGAFGLYRSRAGRLQSSQAGRTAVGSRLQN